MDQSENVQLDETQQRLVELYIREPSATQVARIMGISRSTIYRYLNAPGVREAIEKRTKELSSTRDTKVDKAQDAAIDLISDQLERMLRAQKEDPSTYTVQDICKLMQVAEKLGTMRKKAREEGGAVGGGPGMGDGSIIDWDTDPAEDGS